jgi:hypothetical protein
MTLGQTKDVRQPRKIRYTREEWTMVVQRARAAGRPPARYVREVSLGAMPKARRTQEHDEIVYELGRIGTTLTQLRSVVREAGFGTHENVLEAALTELLAAVRRLT